MSGAKTRVGGKTRLDKDYGISTRDRKTLFGIDLILSEDPDPPAAMEGQDTNQKGHSIDGFRNAAS